MKVKISNFGLFIHLLVPGGLGQVSSDTDERHETKRLKYLFRIIVLHRNLQIAQHEVSNPVFDSKRFKLAAIDEVDAISADQSSGRTALTVWNNGHRARARIDV